MPIPPDKYFIIVNKLVHGAQKKGWISTLISDAK